MRIVVTILLFTASATLAGPPTTRPVVPLPPAVPISRPEILDLRRPAFVPQFAAAASVPAGHFAEREYAYRNTYPSPIYYGYPGYGGYYGRGPFGLGGGSWGSTQVQFR